MKTLATDYIKANGLDALCAAYHITARRHGQFPNLVQLKYSQIDSDMSQPIVQECRGIIVDEADDWRVVAYPFRKFFNSTEGHAATIDWTTARVYEKLDGSLMTLYWYRGEWRVASSGLPDAAGPVNLSGGTFADLFWKTWKELGYALPAPPETDEDIPGCAMFELMTPYNRVVVRHDKPRLVLIGFRNLDDFTEAAPEIVDAQRLGWEVVRSFPLGCIDDCLAAATAINPMDGEGYVVCDANFNRVKVKSPQYVALAHLKEGISGRRLLEIVRVNESDEFLSYFPEFREAFEVVRTTYNAMCDELDAEYARLKSIESQKEFALHAVKTRASSPLFAIRAGKCATVREFFATSTMPALERAIGLDLTTLVANTLEGAPCPT